MSIESLMTSNHLILGLPLLLPSIFCSIRVFSNESTLYIRWPKYWSFSFSISPSSEYSGLMFFRIDWFHLLTVQDKCIFLFILDFPRGSEVKVSACNAEDLGSIPGSGRSPGEGNGNPLQYSCLENPMDRGAWWATVQRVTSVLPMNIQDWFPLGLTGLNFQELASSNWHFSRTTIFLWLLDIQSTIRSVYQ